jgi:transcriptional regulator with XRE-family HTH domain
MKNRSHTLKGPDMWSDEFENYQAGLAKKVRYLRSEVKLSQEKLALLADVDRTLVSKIERSIANPSLEILVKISHCLNVTVDQLLKL